MPDIDDRFIDVNFDEVFDDDSNEFVRGDNGSEHFGDFGRSYEDTFASSILTESEVREAIERIDDAGGGIDRLVTRIYNQRSEGSCVANACSQAHEILQAVQLGKENVTHLSAISLYKRIGRSARSGANVGNGLKEMKSRGILPLDNDANRLEFNEQVMPNTGFKTRYPSNWEPTAAHFSGVEYHSVNTLMGLMTGLCHGFPVIVGREGHSICYVRPMWEKRRFVVKYANSWGNWGDDGYGYDTLSQIKKSAGRAFVLRSVTVRTAA